MGNHHGKIDAVAGQSAGGLVECRGVEVEIGHTVARIVGDTVIIGHAPGFYVDIGEVLAEHRE